MNSSEVTGIPAEQMFDKQRKELYKNVIRNRVETSKDIGKVIAINVETGEYEIGEDLVSKIQWDSGVFSSLKFLTFC